MIQRLLACACLAALGACVPAMPASRMAPMGDIMQQIEPNPALIQKVSLGQVEVNEEASGNMVATISADTFRETLTSALLSANLAARGATPGDYVLDAKMTELDVPSLGFSFDVPCTVDYRLTRRADNALIYHEAIRQEGHGGFGDAFNGQERATIATANGVRENVTHLIRVLSQLDIAHPNPSSVPRLPNPLATAAPGNPSLRSFP